MVRRLLGALVLTATVAAGAQAQLSTPFQFISGSLAPVFNDYQGKFTVATIGQTGQQTGSPFQIFCVDPMQFVYVGGTYEPNAVVTPFSATDFSNTESQFMMNTPVDGATHPIAQTTTLGSLLEYKEAAYLALNMPTSTTPGGPSQQDEEFAMWTVMGYDVTGMAGYNASFVNPLVTAAVGGAGSIDIFDWAVISDPTDNNQEFIYMTGGTGVITSTVTPEPATMSLMAMGLVGMASASLRRRKRKS